MPVVIGALGTISMGLDQNLQLFPDQPSAIDLPKIILIRTAYIIRDGEKRRDLLLGSGLTRRCPPNNQQARINLKL